MYYCGSRYYDPVVGRWINGDSVLADTNLYAYCYNNPVMFCDPTGSAPDDVMDENTKAKMKAYKGLEYLCEEGREDVVQAILDTKWIEPATVTINNKMIAGGNTITIPNDYPFTEISGQTFYNKGLSANLQPLAWEYLINANNNGAALIIEPYIGGYRSYTIQEALWIANGKNNVLSAAPGTGAHESGKAFDVRYYKSDWYSTSDNRYKKMGNYLVSGLKWGGTYNDYVHLYIS